MLEGPPEAEINSTLTECDLCIIQKKVDNTDREEAAKRSERGP